MHIRRLIVTDFLVKDYVNNVMMKSAIEMLYSKILLYFYIMSCLVAKRAERQSKLINYLQGELQEEVVYEVISKRGLVLS